MADRSICRMLVGETTRSKEEPMASKDKGGKSEKKKPKRNLKEKRAAKKQKQTK